MNNSDVRRSVRGNKGMPPDWFGNPVATRKQSRRVKGRDGLFGSVQNLVPDGVQLGASRARSADDVRSVRTHLSVASSIRRKQREIDMKAAEELARIEVEKEALKLQQLEREAELVRMRQQNDAENLHEEWSDDGDLEELGAGWVDNNFGDQVRDQQEAQVRDRVPANEDHVPDRVPEPSDRIPATFEQCHHEEYSTPMRRYSPLKNPYEENIRWRAAENCERTYTRNPFDDRRSENGDNEHMYWDRRPMQHERRLDGNDGRAQNYPHYHDDTPAPNNAINTATDDSGIGKLADALMKALEKPSRQQSSDDKHYMARQTIGRMKLPDFEGDPMEWPTFIAQFKSSTEECNFSPSENLVRLRGCLKKKARDCVKALLVSPENLEEILETLKSNFGRKEQVIWSLIDNVKKINSPKENDYNSIMEFSNSVRNMSATMKTLKSQAHLQNPQLLRDLVNKLPGNMKYDWGKFVAEHEEDITLDEFSGWLKKATRALSFTAEPSSIDDKNLKGGKKESSFILDEDKKKCVKCNSSEHKLSDCKKFKSLELNARWKLVNEKKLCYSCLKSGHRATACRYKKNCGLDDCKRFHHQLLHKLEQKKTEDDENAHEESHSVFGGGTAHLPIIPVIVSGPAGEVKTYALLDEGSTATFMDSSLAKEIGAQGPSDPLYVNVMNGCADDVDSERVTFKIKGDYGAAKQFTVHGARTVNALNVGAQSLDFEKLQENYGYLEGLPVASYVDAKPKLLLGQPEKLLSLARKYVHRSKQAPVAYKTMLGWVISGKFRRDGGLEQSFNINEDYDELHKHVEESFSVESFGVRVTAESAVLRCAEDKRAEAIMEASTKRIADGFQTGSQLPQAPDCWNSIPVVRLKFRQRKIAFAAKIMYMYHRVKRFLRRGIDRDKPPDDHGEEDNFIVAPVRSLQDWMSERIVKPSFNIEGECYGS